VPEDDGISPLSLSWWSERYLVCDCHDPYQIDVVTGEITQLAQGRDGDVAPESGAITYTSGNAIYIKEPDQAPRLVFEAAPDYFVAEPEWSPDETQIAFTYGLGNEHHSHPTPPPPEEREVDSRVTIRSDSSGSRVGLRGRVWSDDSACLHRVMLIKKARAGRDRVVARTRSGSGGRWFIRMSPRARGAYYAVATRDREWTADGTDRVAIVTCLPARSERTYLNERP
jgi:hypothetical protein